VFILPWPDQKYPSVINKEFTREIRSHSISWIAQVNILILKLHFDNFLVYKFQIVCNNLKKKKKKKKKEKRKKISYNE